MQTFEHGCVMQAACRAPCAQSDATRGQQDVGSFKQVADVDPAHALSLARQAAAVLRGMPSDLMSHSLLAIVVQHRLAWQERTAGGMDTHAH